MSVNTGAAEKKNISENTSLTEKNNKLESAMVEVGSLVTYLAVSAVRYSIYAARAAAARINGTAVPVASKISGAFKKTVSGIANFGAEAAEFGRKFKERIISKGFGKALLLQMSDIVTAAKGSKKFAKSFVNHAVPVLGIACLVFVVADKASADYGVTVEYNGQEIGVVSEASVIDEAQKVIADRAVYYDTGSEYITATLSIKPIGAQDEIIDEQMLADVIQEQIETQAPVKEEPAAESEEDNSAAENGKSFEIYGVGADSESEKNYSESAADFIQNEDGVDSNKVEPTRSLLTANLSELFRKTAILRNSLTISRRNMTAMISFPLISTRISNIPMKDMSIPNRSWIRRRSLTFWIPMLRNLFTMKYSRETTLGTLQEATA